jgi:hypothetical protein
MARKSKNDPNYIDLDTLLNNVAYTVRKHGWVSKGDARINPALTPTVEQMNRLLPDNCKPTRTDKETVKACKAWVKTLATSVSDYEIKLYDVFFLGDDGGPRLIEERHVAMAASAVGVFVKRAEQAKKNAKIAKKAGPHVGSVGERIQDVPVTLAEQRYNPRWDCYLHVFLDVKGSRLTWFTNTEKGKVGDRLLLRGTVKSHDVYGGIPSTKLNRCKVVPAA